MCLVYVTLGHCKAGGKMYRRVERNIENNTGSIIDQFTSPMKTLLHIQYILYIVYDRLEFVRNQTGSFTIAGKVSNSQSPS